LERQLVRRRRAEAREGPRDRTEPVDLHENPLGRLLQRRIEVARILPPPRPLQVLDTEADRGQRVLDLVGDLTRHLAPREHARRAGEGRRVVQRHDTAAGTRDPTPPPPPPPRPPPPPPAPGCAPPPARGPPPPPRPTPPDLKKTSPHPPAARA